MLKPAFQVVGNLFCLNFHINLKHGHPVDAIQLDQFVEQPGIFIG
jgi:hypothetical protein